MINPTKTPLTVKQASEFSGYSKSHLHLLIKKGKIPAYKTGDGKSGKVLIAKEELAEFLFARPIKTEEEIAEEIIGGKND